MTADPKSVDDMNQILKAFSGETMNESNNNQSNNQTNNLGNWDPMNTPAGVTTEQDKSWMKTLLERTQGNLNETTDKVIQENKDSKEFNEALQTQKTENGAKIGSWEISQSLTESKKKIYDVIHAQTKEPIASDLMVYEAAYALTKLLNKGYTITDGEVQDVLKLEEEFSRAYQDSAQFKGKANKAKRKGDTKSADLFEARLDKSKGSALRIKERLKKKIRSM